MAIRKFSSTRISALIAASVLAGILLTGCTERVQGAASPAPSPSATAEATKPPIAGEPGDPLTAEEAKQLNGQSGTLRPYELADGSWIILDFKKPLPEAVRAEVAAAIAQSDPDDRSAFFAANDAQAAKVGKTLVVVRYFNAPDMYGNFSDAWRTTAPSNSFPGSAGPTPEDAVAQIQHWIDDQRDPSQIEIIIVEG